MQSSQWCEQKLLLEKEKSFLMGINPVVSQGPCEKIRDYFSYLTYSALWQDRQMSCCQWNVPLRDVFTRDNLHAQCGEGEQQGVVRTTSLSELQYMSTLFGTVCRWHQSCHHKQTGSYEFYSVNLWQMKAEMETSVDYTCSRLSDYSVTLQNVSPSSQSVEIPY